MRPAAWRLAALRRASRRVQSHQHHRGVAGTSARATSDSAKCILIFWCLFAFIACGFEHSVANMTIFSVALLGNHPPSVSLGGMFYNLAWVTLGNAITGALFVAGAY